MHSQRTGGRQAWSDGVGERHEIRLEYHHLGVAVGPHVGQLLAGVAVVGVDRHEASAETGVEGLEVLGTVAEVQGYPAPGPLVTERRWAPMASARRRNSPQEVV